VASVALPLFLPLFLTCLFPVCLSGSEARASVPADHTPLGAR
jgi:hypothetical protein